jgi:hypothetical protein
MDGHLGARACLGQQLFGGDGGVFTDLAHLGPQAGKPRW